METKKDIRKRVLDIRRHITEKEWEEKSHRIYEKVVTHPFFLDAEVIYCYIDYEREPGTREIIRKAWELGKKTVVPKVQGAVLAFYEIHAFSELQKGYRGILEPQSACEASYDGGLVIVPGVAFDKNRNRIGYGKGFYDRFLNTHIDLKTMAIAFESQIVDEIPAETRDVRPQVLVTEEQSYV